MKEDFIVRHMKLIVLIVGLMFVFISNRYTCLLKLREIDKLQQELKDVKYESLAISGQLIGNNRLSQDEFAVRKGHIYKTIVVDLDTGRILYVGEGKGADALDKFWKRVKRKGLIIKHVAIDLLLVFISSVFENCPNTMHVSSARRCAAWRGGTAPTSLGSRRRPPAPPPPARR